MKTNFQINSLIDYFPVKLIATDFVLVASWFPAFKAARQRMELR